MVEGAQKNGGSDRGTDSYKGNWIATSYVYGFNTLLENG
jgi:hypothetical protein